MTWKAALVLGFLAFLVFTAPSFAGGMAHRFAEFLGDGFNAAVAFLDSATSGSVVEG